jgi:hypothetical protein
VWVLSLELIRQLEGYHRQSRVAIHDTGNRTLDRVQAGLFAVSKDALGAVYVREDVKVGALLERYGENTCIVEIVLDDRCVTLLAEANKVEILADLIHCHHDGKS